MTDRQLLECLIDRPCTVCKFHTDAGCERWSCVFEKKTDDTENDGDLISRQVVLELVADYDLSMGQVVKGIHALPSIENKGEWIESKERSKHWYCSVCGGIHTDPETGKWRETFDYRYPFCPNCGAKMKGSE